MGRGIIAKVQKNRPKVSDKKKDSVFSDMGYKCWYCGESLNFENYPNPNYGVLDHIEPFIKGGSNKRDNLRSCCFKCNQSKGSKSVEEYRYHLSKNTNQFKAYSSLMDALHNFKFKNQDEIFKALDEAKNAIPWAVFYGETIGK